MRFLWILVGTGSGEFAFSVSQLRRTRKPFCQSASARHASEVHVKLPCVGLSATWTR